MSNMRSFNETCPRCGKKIVPPYPDEVKNKVRYLVRDLQHEFRPGLTVDLCEECILEFQEWMKGEDK